MVFWFFGFLGSWSLSQLSWVSRSLVGSEKVRTKHAVSDRRERERSEQACESEKLSSVPPQARSDYMPCLKISGNKGQGSAEIPSKGVARKRAKRASAALATGFRQDFKRTHRYHNLIVTLPPTKMKNIAYKNFVLRP